MNTDGVSLAICIDIDKQMYIALSRGLNYLASINETHKYEEFEKVTRGKFDELKEEYIKRGLI